jgi:concanavalin A-like lectin/glucanase superfamily protein/chitobiase/beta-hexosaminidase-like protein/calcineurin-like phosphoesterase family protein
MSSRAELSRPNWFRRVLAVAAAALLALAALSVAPNAPAARAAADPVIMAVGDIACDPANSGYNGGNGDPTDCRQKYTANVVSAVGAVDAVLPLGDEQYGCGGLTAFHQVYDPTWGVQNAKARPVPGNHEYQTLGGTGCPTQHDAAGYYGYFGATAGDPSKGYYSYNLGSWHIVAVNSEGCYSQTNYDNTSTSLCPHGSPLETWLRNDLAANPTSCKLVYWHEPRFSSTPGKGDDIVDPLWQDVAAAKVDVVLNGHQHFYERLAQMNASGAADPNGTREFIVGTGGESFMPLSTRLPTSQASNDSTFGVLKMVLHPGGYDWQFVPVAGSTFTDSGSTACHTPAAPDTTPPTTTLSCNGSSCTSGWYAANPVTITLSASDSGGSGVSGTFYTTDGTDPSTSSSAVRYTGAFAVSSSTTVRYYSKDNAGNAEAVHSQSLQVDIAAPQTTIACNGAACTGTYSAATTISLSAADTGGSGVALTRYTTDGTDPATSATAISYTAPFTITSSTTVRYSSTDIAGNIEPTHSQFVPIGLPPDATPPTTTITCNGAGCTPGWYTVSPVSVALAATDTGGSGLAKTLYTTDGTDPATSSTAITYSQPFNVASSTTVRFGSVDNAGNVEASHAQQILVDANAPTSSASCNGAPCSSSWYRISPITVSLSATDSGGSGVAATYYTTDGTDPATSPTAFNYTGSFAIAATSTVRYYSRDVAGNAEPTRSQPVQIDTVMPTTPIYCNGDPCQSAPYTAPVTVSLPASDAGGSGLARTVYTTDGSDPTTSTSAHTYAAPFTVAQTTTVRASSTDNAGNVEPAGTQQITLVNSSPSYASLVDGRSSLIAHWRLGEASGTTAADVTGHYNGTYASGVTLGVAGAIANDPNTAASFNGTVGKVTVPALPSATDFSIESWSYLTSSANANYTAYGGKGTVRLLVRPGSPNSPTSAYAAVSLNGTEYVLQPNSTVSNVNSWVHWVLTRAGNTLTLYRNGVRIGQRTDLPATATASLAGTIGMQTGGLCPMAGSLDEVAIYSAALSAADVTSDYTAATNGAPPPPPPPPPPPNGSYRDAVMSQASLLSYWRLGEASGTAAADAKGNRTGTYSGGVTLGAPGAIVNDPDTSATLNGSTGKVSLPSLPSVTDFSITGWTNLAAGAVNNTTGNNCLYGTLGNVRLLARPGTATAAYAGVWLAGTEYVLQPTATQSNLGRWVQWALTRAGGTLSLYRNGTLVAQRTDLPVTATANIGGWIGAQGGSNYFLNGQIDDVSVYNSALSGSTVTSQYNAALSGPAPAP